MLLCFSFPVSNSCSVELVARLVRIKMCVKHTHILMSVLAADEIEKILEIYHT